MIIAKIIVFVIVISVIITIHELGHFLTAKKFGILCHEFSIGMGPAIYKKKKGETTYAIRCIPLGGYVSMAGEQFTEDMIKPGDELGLNLEDGIVSEIVLDPNLPADVRGRVVRRNLYARNNEMLEIALTDDYEIPAEEIELLDGVAYTVKEDAFYVDAKSRLQIAPFKRCIESKPLWQRFITIFAGPFMNFVLAIFIYLICAFATGTPKYSSNKVGSIDNNYAAYSHMAVGEKITGLNGNNINSWNDFREEIKIIASSGVTTLTVTMEDKNGASRTETINPDVLINSIGISSLNIKDKYKGLTAPGVQVGNVGVRYKNKPSKKATQLSNGDIIQKMYVYEYNKEYDASKWVSVSSWSDITNLLKDADVSTVYFEYYDCETDTIHNTYTDKQKAETYGNEVLKNQRIEKIRLYLGIDPIKHHNFFESVGLAGKNFWKDFTLIFRTLKILIHPTGVRQIGVNNLSGVVGIYSMIGSYMKAGMVALLLFMALLSVNIGVMNLLPIPALDGGRILFIIIEAITRKPLNRKVEAMINNIVFILLLIFMIYIAFNDVMRIIK